MHLVNSSFLTGTEDCLVHPFFPLDGHTNIQHFFPTNLSVSLWLLLIEKTDERNKAFRRYIHLVHSVTQTDTHSDNLLVSLPTRKVVPTLYFLWIPQYNPVKAKLVKWVWDPEQPNFAKQHVFWAKWCCNRFHRTTTEYGEIHGKSWDHSEKDKYLDSLCLLRSSVGLNGSSNLTIESKMYRVSASTSVSTCWGYAQPNLTPWRGWRR